jgi:hypothetical protein
VKTLDDRVPVSVVASMLGISVVAFHQLVGKGVVPREGRAGYPLRDTVKACCEYYRKIAAGRSEEGEQKVLASARARAALATAEQMELRTQIARGKYVPLDALRVALDDMIITYRQELLRAIPSAAAAVVIKFAPEACNEVHEAVDDAVREALNRFADGVSNLTTDHPPIATQPTQPRRWRGPAPRGIGHDRNRDGEEVPATGDFGTDAYARHRGAVDGLESGTSNGLAPPDGRDQRCNGIALLTR